MSTWRNGFAEKYFLVTDFSSDLECDLIKVSLPDYDPRPILHWRGSMNFHAVDMNVTQGRLRS